MAEVELRAGLANGAMRRLVRRQTHCLLSRLRSIHADSAWLHALAASHYPHLPVFFNQRAGAWYHLAGPTPHPPTCYFKSTDGHYHTASFSLSRLNLPLVTAAAAAGGALVVDVTARGKRFPDSAVALAIWAAVLNALLAPHLPAPPPPLESYFPPWQPPSVRAACAGVAAAAVAGMQASLRQAIVAALAPHLRAPLLPLYVCQPCSSGSGGAEDAWEALPPLLEGALQHPRCTPLVFVSASRAVGPLGDAASAQAGWKYLQGAGDDAEGWAGPLGLTPALLWRHASALIGAATAEECARLLALALREDAGAGAALREEACAGAGAGAGALAGAGAGAAAPGPLLRHLAAAASHFSEGVCGQRLCVADALAWGRAEAAAQAAAAVAAAGHSAAGSGWQAGGVGLVVLVHAQPEVVRPQCGRAGGGGAGALGSEGEGEEGEEGGEEGGGEVEEDPSPHLPRAAHGASASGAAAARHASACTYVHHCAAGSSAPGSSPLPPVLTLTLPSGKRGQTRMGDAWVSTVLPALCTALKELEGGGEEGGQQRILLAFSSAAVAPVAAAVGAALYLLLLASGAEGGGAAAAAAGLDKGSVRTAIALGALRSGAPSVDRRLAKQLNRYFLSGQ